MDEYTRMSYIVQRLDPEHSQVNLLGWGRFQVAALTAFIAFKIADGMELATANVM